MFAEIMEQNKTDLQSIGSYLVPRLDKMIDLLRKVESTAGPDFHQSIQHLKFAKGDLLVKEGTVCRYIWMLERGIARQYINKNGAEPIACFFVPGEFMVSNNGFAMDAISKENIQFITDASVYAISRIHIEQLKFNYPIINEIEKLGFECRSCWHQEHTYRFMYSNAREKYRYFVRSQTILLQYISITDLASHLGISLETLSRIRSRKNC